MRNYIPYKGMGVIDDPCHDLFKGVLVLLSLGTISFHEKMAINSLMPTTL